MNIEEYIASGQIEAYALGMLSAEENAEVQQMMKSHKAVAEAVKEAEEALGSLAKGYAVAPKPEWREDVLQAALGDDFQKQSETPVKTLPTTAPQSNKSWLAVAATVAFLVSAGFNAFQFTKLQEFDKALLNANLRIATLETKNTSVVANFQSLQNDLDVYRNPATAQFVMNPVEGKASNLRADVLWNSETEMVYVDVKNLPTPPASMQYQLWALVDGKPIDMGVFDLPQANEGLQRMKKIPGADAFAVTLEKSGGVPSPTMEQMYVMGTPLSQA